MGTQTTYSTSGPAPYLQPLVEDNAGRVQALAKSEMPIYNYDRVAGFDPLQLQAQQEAANLKPAEQLGVATQMAGLAGLKAGNVSYDAGQYGNYYTAPAAYQSSNIQNTFNAPAAYQTGSFNAPSVQAARLGAAPTGQATLSNYNTGNLEKYQMAGPERVVAQSFLQPGTSSAYMSPYMQAVIDATKRETKRESDIAGQQEAAQAAKYGAFGGSRHGIVEAERARNLDTRLSDIQSQGMQSAFTNAQQQFNAEQQAKLQANLANQAAGLTAGGQNLSALLGVQSLGYQGGLQQALANAGYQNQMGLANLNMAGQYGMQQGAFDQAANMANQQANMWAQQQGEQSRQFGANQGMTSAQLAAQYGMTANQLNEMSRQFGYGNQMTAAQLAAQYGLSGDQLSEMSRQFGANLGMQGINAQLNAAGLMGNLGTAEFGQTKDIINAMNTAGAQRQGLQQQQYDTRYQDWLREVQFPYQQLSWESDIYRGLPGATSANTIYQSPPSPISQAAGATMTGYQLFGKAAGGQIKDPSKRTSGLADLLLNSMR